MTVKKKREEDLNYAEEIIEYHRLPDTDYKEHVPDIKCWCEPQCTYKNPQTGYELWLHNLTQ